MTNRNIPTLREAVPSVAAALSQASLFLRQGDLPGAVYWVRVAADLDEDEQALGQDHILPVARR